MRYKSITTIFFGILLLTFTLTMYIMYINEGTWYFYILPFAVITIALLIFKSPIDRYFFKFQNIGFDDKIKGMLQMEYPIIAGYSEEKKKEFYNRMFYFMYERECYLVAGETDELDLYHSLIINAPGVILSMDGPVDEARDVERIAAYNHAFPSPKMKFIHAAEYDEEDGVIIVSLEQMVLSQRQPDAYFPINYFLWAERKVAVQEGFPEVPIEFMEKFEEVWGFTQKSAEQFIGYELRNTPAVAICVYVLRKEKMEELFPAFLSKIKNYMSA